MLRALFHSLHLISALDDDVLDGIDKCQATTGREELGCESADTDESQTDSTAERFSQNRRTSTKTKMRSNLRGSTSSKAPTWRGAALTADSFNAALLSSLIGE